MAAIRFQPRLISKNYLVLIPVVYFALAGAWTMLSRLWVKDSFWYEGVAGAICLLPIIAPKRWSYLICGAGITALAGFMLWNTTRLSLAHGGLIGSPLWESIASLA